MKEYSKRYAGTDGVSTAGVLEVLSRKDFCDTHIYNENSALTSILLENEYIGEGKYNFYIKDYQGNNRVVFDQNNVTDQENHYYPYGMTFAEGIATTSQPYKYGGKELDRVNGLDMYDFGARNLDPATAIWNSIDPLAESYYRISPYAYCAGNPIQFIDPNGKEIWIGGVLYQPGMSIDNQDEFTSRAISYLNIIYNNGGKKAVTRLVDSKKQYNVKNEKTKDKNGNTKEGVFVFRENKNGGDLIIGGIMDMNKSQGIEGMAHELFHGVQYDHGQGERSINNEVEAYAFDHMITMNWTQTTDDFDFNGYTSMSLNGNGSIDGIMFQQYMNIITTTQLNCYFNAAISAFKKGSFNNSNGTYNKYPLTRINQINNLLFFYYPKSQRK